MKLIPFILSAVASTTAIYAQAPYPGNDAACGVTQTAGFLDAYTGNMAFSTTDIVVAGAVGERGLAFQRFTTSRTSQKENLFGLGHNWAHNWQWEMVDAGRDSQGRAVLSVRVPGGWVHRFTETSPGQWWPEPSEQHRLVVSGNSYTILHRDGGEVRFTRSQTSKGTIYTLGEITDDTGHLWTLTWNAGQLVQITEPAGRWLKINYSSLHAPGAAASVKPYTVITGVSASDGQKVVYNYIFPSGTDYPVLTTADYADGTKGAYTYAAPRAGTRLLLSSVDDPHVEKRVRGRSFQFHSEPDAAFGQLAEANMTGSTVPVDTVTADKAGLRSYAIKQENGATVYRTYNPGGNIAQEIDPLGFAKSYTYDASGRGFKISETDELGKITHYDRDSKGKVLKTTFPDSSTRTWQRDTQGRVLKETNELGQTKSYVRDAQGRVTKVQLTDGRIAELAYNMLGQPIEIKDNSNGAVTTFTYDTRGLRTNTTNALGHVVTFTYDERDHVASTTDANRNTTRYEYDASGRVTKVTYAEGATASTTYDNFGQVTKSVDASGAARTHIYDAFGRRTTSFDPLGHEFQFIYAPLGQGPFNQPIGSSTPEGRISTTAFDAAGHEIARTVAAGTHAAATIRTTYDARGRRVSVANPRNQITQFFYDARGRRVKAMNALSNATTYTYDAAGHKLSETDAKGNTTKWTYDVAGRELTKTDAKGQVVTRTYDGTGRLATLTDPKGSTYRFEYNLIGQPTALVYPDGSRETTTYDKVGNKLTYTNRSGITQTFTYDSRNREILSTWSDGSQRIVKAYDMAGRMTVEDNGVSKLSYSFDGAGRLISETQDLSPVVTGGAADPALRKVTYTYTDDGQRETLEYPDDSFVKYTYNERGQMQDIVGDGVPPPIASYEYDEAGNATQMPRENNTATTMAYDAVNRVTTVSESSPRSPLSELDYVYDEADNRTSTTQTLSPLTSNLAPRITRDSYQYDPIYQVTGADYAAPVARNGQVVGGPEHAERFSYDAVGNRVQTTEITNTQFQMPNWVTNYTANALNQYIQIGNTTPTYDRNGNLASLKGWRYRYDALNRLIEASDAEMTAKFYYDAKNRCVARSYNGATTLNYYDNWNLIEERDLKGNEVGRYVHGRKIDEIVVMVNRHGTFYPHRDVLGNVTMLTGIDGKLVERYSYSVTGGVTIFDATGKEMAFSRVGNRWLYTGREWLQEVGLYDYRNRVYSAELGRFLQTDPIRFSAGDINIYRYCGNRVSRFADPTGTVFGEGAILVGVGMVGGGVIGAVGGGLEATGVAIWDLVTGEPLPSVSDFTNRIEKGAAIGALAGGALGCSDPDPLGVMCEGAGIAFLSSTAGGLWDGAHDSTANANTAQNSAPTGVIYGDDGAGGMVAGGAPIVLAPYVVSSDGSNSGGGDEGGGDEGGGDEGGE